MGWMFRVPRARWLALTMLLVIGVGAPAALGSLQNHVTITGPTSVKKGSTARFVVKGTIVSPANKLTVFTDRTACATHELTELQRNASVEIDQGFLPSGTKFTWHEARALAVGTHYLCVYLIHRAVGVYTTYARASHKWVVHP